MSTTSIQTFNEKLRDKDPQEKASFQKHKIYYFELLTLLGEEWAEEFKADLAEAGRMHLILGRIRKAIKDIPTEDSKVPAIPTRKSLHPQT